jgi:hypothetical protein
MEHRLKWCRPIIKQVLVEALLQPSAFVVPSVDDNDSTPRSEANEDHDDEIEDEAELKRIEKRLYPLERTSNTSIFLGWTKLFGVAANLDVVELLVNKLEANEPLSCTSRPGPSTPLSALPSCSLSLTFTPHT